MPSIIVLSVLFCAFSVSILVCFEKLFLCNRKMKHDYNDKTTHKFYFLLARNRRVSFLSPHEIMCVLVRSENCAFVPVWHGCSVISLYTVTSVYILIFVNVVDVRLYIYLKSTCSVFVGKRSIVIMWFYAVFNARPRQTLSLTNP